jgi:hypothetical protein
LKGVLEAKHMQKRAAFRAEVLRYMKRGELNVSAAAYLLGITPQAAGQWARRHGVDVKRAELLRAFRLGLRIEGKIGGLSRQRRQTLEQFLRSKGEAVTETKRWDNDAPELEPPARECRERPRKHRRGIS